MPILEKKYRLETEADVLRLSTLQLLHPVNIAIQETCPPGATIVCAAEKHGGPKSRFDVQWSLYSDREELMAILAVLEIKSTGGHDCQMRKAMSRAPQPNLLRGNAIWLSKQAGKYSNHCADIAVFDWNAMFIFNYIHDQSGRGGTVRGMYFDEFGPTKGMIFRRLLFGICGPTTKAVRSY